MKIIACFATLLFLNQLFTQNEKFTKTLEKLLKERHFLQNYILMA
jgi:hypothetical protein